MKAATLAEPAAHARFADYLELTKPRLSLLSVITAVVGYVVVRAPSHGGTVLRELHFLDDDTVDRNDHLRHGPLL